MENNELLDKILKLQADNKIAFMTMDGLHSIDIVDFDNQSLEGKLYDLNRDRGTLYSMANEGKNKRWINDLAMVYFIEYWGERIEKQRQEIVNLKSEIRLKDKEIADLNSEYSNKVTELSQTIVEKDLLIDKCMAKFNEIDKVTDTSTATSVINEYKIEKQILNTNKQESRMYRMGDEHVQNISFQI